MRIGIVCPFSWDVPGGVQMHVRDLAEELLRRGEHVSVLAPADDDTPVPDYLTSTGRAIPVPYNGSVARLSIGPMSAARTRRWLADGHFDVVHVHEPWNPSLSLIAVLAAEVPVVATFHYSAGRSRIVSAAYGILQPVLEKITAPIAVSDEARTTLVQHVGGDAIVIPNGVYVDHYADAPLRPEWRGENGTISFLGRIDEPRKGLPVLLEAWPTIWRARSGVRLLVAGRGDVQEAREALPPECRDSVTFLGQVSDRDKGAMLATSDVYVAPHTGGESFGIVLLEAMAAGTPVLASELAAFRAVLDDGRLGVLVPVEDAGALASAALQLLDDPDRRNRLKSGGLAAVRRYDWSRVAGEIAAVYEMAIATRSRKPAPWPHPRRIWSSR